MNNALTNHDCPPLMSDGRLFTDYRPNCDVHLLIEQQNNVNNSYDLKQFLTSHANDFRSINKDFYDNKASCKSCGSYKLSDPNKQISYWNNRKISIVDPIHNISYLQVKLK